MKLTPTSLAFVLIALTSCHDDNTNGPTGGGNGPGTVSGLVMDIGTGVGIASADVSASGQTTTTDDRGYFTITGLSAGTVTVAVNKDGYAPGFATPTLGDNGAPALVTLKKEGTPQAYDPSQPGTLAETTEAGPYAVIFEGGALDTTDTNLTVSITPVDPTKESSVLPGDFETSGSNLLFPVTFAEFSILDSNNNRIQLKSGQSAIVELPIPPTLRDQYAIGAKIHCYAFNTSIGAWDDFVDGTVRASSVDGTTPVLAASIKHFSWYGGAPEGNNCVDVYGQVVSAVDGKPLANARVEATPGGTAYSDSNGNFKVLAGADGGIKLFAYQTGIDTDGSVTGTAGAKFIVYGEVTQEIPGLTLKACNDTSSGAAPESGTPGGPDNPIKVTVGAIGKEAYQVTAVLVGGEVGGIEVTVEGGVPDEDGQLENQSPVSGVKITLTGGSSGTIALTELAPGSGVYSNASATLDLGRAYQVAIDVDGNGSIDGQGSASVVGNLTVTVPQDAGSYAAATFAPSWTDSGITAGDASYSALYSVIISGGTDTVVATAYYTGTAANFQISDLQDVIVETNDSITNGGPLPPGDYTMSLTAFSGFSSGASGNFSESNNITGVGLTGTAFSVNSADEIDFTLE